jgi:predicted membrane-bound spermidine synthase
MAKFGVTTPMVSIVLSVFMAGLGLGSWLGGVYTKRFPNASAARSLRLYALLELLIGSSGWIAPLLLLIGYTVLRDLGKSLAWGSSSYYFASGAWILLALLPWTTCMGATFPFAMAAIDRLRTSDSAHSFSFLYLANVLGAIMGTLIPAFVLIETLGFEGTLRVASTLNFLLAIGVFFVSFGLAGSITRIQTSAHRTTDAPRNLLWLLFSTGLCSMAMEVVWIREFTVYLGNVVYAFALILAIYLIATFAGSSIYRRQIRKQIVDSLPTRSWSFVWIPLALCALLPLLTADPRWQLPESENVWASLGLGAIRAVIGIAPFSALTGFLTPMLVDEWSGGNPDRAGKAYAMNVLGSILGPLIAGFVILPWAGEHWGLCILALPLLLIGIYNAADSKLTFALTTVAALLIALFAKDYGTQFEPRVELRDHTATIIATGQGMHRRLLVNGTGMTKLTTITKMMAHLPLAFHESKPQDALVICFGMGTTFRSMMSWGINVTAVELVPSVPKLFYYFHSDGPDLLKSPQAHIVVDDGRRFLERSSAQFDVIAADPPPPIGAPASSLLYSQEFYDILKPHLRKGGIVQIWCPGDDDATMAAITTSIRNAFPYVRAFESVEGWGTHYIASMDPLPQPTPEELADKLTDRSSTDLTEWTHESTATDLFKKVLQGEQPLDQFFDPVPNAKPLSDDRPVNEYFLLRYRGEDDTQN